MMTKRRQPRYATEVSEMLENPIRGACGASRGLEDPLPKLEAIGMRTASQNANVAVVAQSLTYLAKSVQMLIKDCRIPQHVPLGNCELEDMIQEQVRCSQARLSRHTKELIQVKEQILGLAQSQEDPTRLKMISRSTPHWSIGLDQSPALLLAERAPISRARIATEQSHHIQPSLSELDQSWLLHFDSLRVVALLK